MSELYTLLLCNNFYYLNQSDSFPILISLLILRFRMDFDLLLTRTSVHDFTAQSG